MSTANKINHPRVGTPRQIAYLTNIGLGALLAAGMLVSGSGPAHANPDINPDISTNTITGTLARIRSVVYWSGVDCIPIRAPRYPNGRETMTNIFCGGYSEGNYSAYPGEYVGADPSPFDMTTSLGCALYVNGNLDNSDYAAPGDKHDVSCLRVLVGYDNGSAQSQM